MVEPDWTHAHWHKSSRSENGGTCVECADSGDFVGMRDSADRDGAVLVFEADRWREFIAAVKDGEFDPR
jgi:hypothetical protein